MPVYGMPESMNVLKSYGSNAGSRKEGTRKDAGRSREKAGYHTGD